MTTFIRVEVAYDGQRTGERTETERLVNTALIAWVAPRPGGGTNVRMIDGTHMVAGDYLSLARELIGEVD